MIRDKSRSERMKRMKCTTDGSHSVSFTLVVWVAVVGLAATISLVTLSGCASDQGEGDDQSVTGESGMEHTETENSESESDDGEESGVSLALDETYDVIRKGARLILRYDAPSNSFVGTVQNTTEGVLNRVRVEVHLSNGTELGPTTPVDLASGESAEVSLAATEEPFTGWTPHAEVGSGEHGSGGEGGEGGGEHGSGGEGEHGSGVEGAGEHGEDRESGGEHGEGGEDGEGGGEHGSAGEGDESGGEHGSGG